MPTLTGPDGTVYSSRRTSVPSISVEPTGAASNPIPNKKPPKPPATSKRVTSRPALPSTSSKHVRPPLPPPGAPEIQTKMWLTVFLRRRRQMQRLSHSHLLSYANDIISDLSSTRYETNEFSKDLKGFEKENKQGGVDLASGHYKSLLLTQQPPPANLSADEIGLHLLALFYRSIDSRLPSAMRKHGVDTLRRAFDKLEFWLKKCEDGNNASNESGKVSSSGKKKKKEH
mmetsp:Transcript_20908/g.43620  ORF Transcript_20908/g.43620 Transcript_20908/m.43620 type:complete len:229 (+) Transcript_20908:123-809(+)